MKQWQWINGVWKFDSWKPWMRVLLMAWVHGNELSGQIILRELIDTICVSHGIVFIIPHANPNAVAQNVRQTEKNMNRAFSIPPQGETYEDKRAQELLPLFEQSDILLDIHNTLGENSIPFLISEHPEWNQYFPVDRVIRGLDMLHPGWSDGYMNSIGKKWFCIESGSIYDPQWPEIAKNSIMNFLRATWSIEGAPRITESQSIYQLDVIVKSQSNNVRFIKKWLDFETVHAGEIVGYDWDRVIRAPYDGVILFSYIPTQAGEEICVFGKLQP